jgi:hypothetical protein
MIGLVPLALGLSEGALLSASLATVVIGGLASSTLLTLIVIPVVYTLFMGARARMWRGGREGGDRAEEAPAPPDTAADRSVPAPTVAGAAAVDAPDGGMSVGALGEPGPSDELTTIGRFSNRAQADAALAYLERSGMRVDAIVIRTTTASSRPTSSRLTRLAVQWLREHEPEQLTPPTEPIWELAAPPAYVGAARAVLASNGRAFAPHVRS